MKCTLALAAALALVSIGCNRTNQSKDAVKQAVIEHVSKNAALDTSNLDIDVSSVAFRNNEATAVVSFRPKSAPASEAMQMSYELESTDDKWMVKGKANPVRGPQGTGQQPHGSAGSGGMPPGHPSIDPDAKPPARQQ